MMLRVAIAACGFWFRIVCSASRVASCSAPLAWSANRCARSTWSALNAPGVLEYRFSAPAASVLPGIGTDSEDRTPWLMACNR